MTAKQHAPATQRNREAILAVLRRVLPPRGTVLEIASGTGEHAAFFAPALPEHVWVPSDPLPELRASIEACRAESGAANLRPVRNIDATALDWGVGDIAADLAAIVNINMIHISPWQACEGLMRGAGALLPGGGILLMYGPYRRDGVHTAPSNERFDASLRAQDPRWGVRDLEAVVGEAARHGLSLSEVVQMPANNLSVIFVREQASVA